LNASFDGRPVTLRIESPYLVLIDPMALDGLSSQLAELSAASQSDRLAALHAFGKYGLRIGVHSVGELPPGLYEIGLDAFEPSTSDQEDTRAFDIDSGTVVVIDLGALSAVAGVFTWDKYDLLLQAPVGDYAILEEMNHAVGGPRFALIAADASTPFTGDGAFQLRTGTPSPSARVAG
jgi:hypothetical protein